MPSAFSGGITDGPSPGVGSGEGARVAAGQVVAALTDNTVRVWHLAALGDARLTEEERAATCHILRSHTSHVSFAHSSRPPHAAARHRRPRGRPRSRGSSIAAEQTDVGDQACMA